MVSHGVHILYGGYFRAAVWIRMHIQEPDGFQRLHSGLKMQDCIIHLVVPMYQTLVISLFSEVATAM